VSNTLVIRGDGAENNAITIAPVLNSRQVLRISERGAKLTGKIDLVPRIGCVALPLLNTALCSGDTGQDSVSGFLGDGNDVLDSRNLPAAPLGWTEWFLGPGDDTLLGGASADRISPGTGNDVVSGGPGSDFVDYFGTIDDVRVTLDGIADDGTGGHGNVLPDVEGAAGGLGSDVLVGRDEPDVLDGGFNIGGGAFTTFDVVRGLGGGDSVALGRGIGEGGDGDDDVLGYVSGSGMLSGGSGDDRLFALGQHSVDGGSGDDYVDADRPGTINDIVCGSGSDVVRANATDTVAPDCETVTITS
jgi:hypothetical protein